MKIKDVMHEGTTWAETSTPIRELAKRMRDSDIGAIPVKANGELVGIVTDRDITCRALADSGDLDKMTAKDVMTADVAFCLSDDDIDTALDRMEDKQIRRLPVMNSHNALVGMLSLGDISHKVDKKLTGELMRSVSAHHA